MTKRPQGSSKTLRPEAGPKKSQATAITVVALARRIPEFINECQYRGHSPTTLKEESAVLAKMLRYLQESKATHCGGVEIRQYLNLVAQGGMQRGGRWGAEPRPVRPRTVRNHWSYLRTFFNWLAEQDLSIESCDVSEERLTIKMVSPRLKGDVKVGDTVQAGVIIRNSEVRCNAVEVNWFVKRLVCLNGMVVTGPNGKGAQRRHVGRDWDAPQRNSNLTKPASCGLIPENVAREEWERAIWQQLQTSLRDSLNAGAFNELLERLALTTALQTALEPDTVTERIGGAFNLRPGEQTVMLSHLTQDEDVNRYGLSLWSVLNAVTRTAEDVEDYNRATELEEIGGQLAHLSPHAWMRLVSPN